MTTGQKIAPVAAETICVTQAVDRRAARRFWRARPLLPRPRIVSARECPWPGGRLKTMKMDEGCGNRHARSLLAGIQAAGGGVDSR
jgi:hypothetical protein